MLCVSSTIDNASLKIQEKKEEEEEEEEEDEEEEEYST